MSVGRSVRLHRLLRKNKSIFIALDQGIEHGPKDFNDVNVNPDYIIKQAVKARVNGIILHKGLVLKYFEPFAGKIPLIVKLNGKTNIPKFDVHISAQITTVKDAVEMGADAVGFTIYVGVKEEVKMIEQFSKIEAEAREYGLPIIAWMYPRGSEKERLNVEKLKYAARLGMELGADFIKTYYPGSKSGWSEIVKNAPGSRVLVSGGAKKSLPEFLKMVENCVKAGGAGVAVGRNFWQSKDPQTVAKKLKKIVYG